MKFTVIIIMISDATLCLISNYNNKDTSITDLSKLIPPRTSIKTNMSGYKHLRIKKTVNEVLL